MYSLHLKDVDIHAMMVERVSSHMIVHYGVWMKTD